MISIYAFTQEDLIAATNLSESDYVIVTDLDNANFLINSSSSDVTALTGDITLDSGQVAVLQETEKGWNIMHFGLVDDTEDEEGDQLSIFEDAATRAVDTSSKVYIPAVTFRVSSSNDALDFDVVWEFEAGHKIRGVSGVASTYIYDYSIFGGKVISHGNGSTAYTTYIGDPAITFQNETNWTSSEAELSVASPRAYASISGANCTSFNTSSTLNQSSIGIAAKCYVNNTSYAQSGWGGWDLCVRKDLSTEGLTPNVLGRETAIAIAGDAGVNIEPYDSFTQGMGLAVSHAVSFGLDDYESNISAVTYWTTTSSTTKAKKGLLVRTGTVVEGTRLAEAFALPSNYGISWYSPNNTLAAYFKAVCTNSSGNHIEFGIHSDDLTGERLLKFGYSAITFGNSNVDIGADSQRFSSIYLVNSPDVSSDETLKTLRDSDGSLSDAEMTAALAIAKLPRMFKWISEIDSKANEEDSTVYLHCSPMAQSVWSAMEDAGLDPTEYGFISDGGDNGTYAIKPQELLWLVCAAQQEKIDNFESRLSALEA